MSKPENLPTEYEKRTQQGLELSDRRKDILIPSAIHLIKSTGVSENQIKSETQGDRDKTLTWAVKIYNEKLNEINKTRKNF